jgi:hypothetical protein
VPDKITGLNDQVIKIAIEGKNADIGSWQP